MSSVSGPAPDFLLFKGSIFSVSFPLSNCAGVIELFPRKTAGVAAGCLDG